MKTSVGTKRPITKVQPSPPEPEVLVPYFGKRGDSKSSNFRDINGWMDWIVNVISTFKSVTLAHFSTNHP